MASRLMSLCLEQFPANELVAVKISANTLTAMVFIFTLLDNYMWVIYGRQFRIPVLPAFMWQNDTRRKGLRIH